MPVVVDRIRFGVLNAAQAVFLGLWSMLWISVALVTLLVTGRVAHSLALARTRWAPGLLWCAGAVLDVRGRERVDLSAPCVFVVNHQSMVDIPALFVALPVNLHFMAKKELFRVPFLGWYMRACGMIPVDRQHTPEAIDELRRNGVRIAAGAHVLAFAEGTRSRSGAIAPFKKGAFMLAIQAQVPVVPVALHGARDVLPCDGFAVRPGVIRIEIGAPIPTTGMTEADRDALRTRAHAEVVRMHAGLGGKGSAP